MIRTKKFLQTAAGVFVLVLVAGIVKKVGCGPRVPDGKLRGKVSFVYDGDTIQVSGVGKVRLLGVDALDSRNQSKIREQARNLGMERGQVVGWARKAESFARGKLAGRIVKLEMGREKRGDYGRLLAYVHFDGKSGKINFNRLLLQRGFATAYCAFDYRLKNEFLRTEKEARRRNRGLWGDATSTW